MKRRFTYILLFSIPALLAALIGSLLIVGAAAGILWIFVFGDNPWPKSANNTLTAIFILINTSFWIFLLYTAYVVGKKQENDSPLNRKHIMVSVGATALLLLLVVLHQWGVGNIGSKSDDVLCAEFCRGKGYAGSGMPPRDSGAPICSCFDAQGREAVKVLMMDVTARPGK
jgi:hypothetical protein